MKIIDIIDFYYSHYDIIDIKIEKDNGLSGKYHAFTKNEAIEFLSGYEHEIAANIIFETCYTFMNGITKVMDIPKLYILYK